MAYKNVLRLVYSNLHQVKAKSLCPQTDTRLYCTGMDYALYSRSIMTEYMIMGVSYRDESQLPANRIDHPQALPLADASMDHGDPHIPRRKRSKPTELIRPLELLAAANALAAAGGRQDELEDDYMPDNLSCLAAAAVAESESDAELARAPENGHQVTVKPEKTTGMLCDGDPCKHGMSAECDRVTTQ